jgi:hypothetical protein
MSLARDARFRRGLKQAEAQRRRWLRNQGLADEHDGSMHLRPGALATLWRRELARVAVQLLRELGLDYHALRQDEPVEGVLRRRVDMMSDRIALVERAHDFILVPWRPSPERRLDQTDSGIIREGETSWTFSRGRGGPVIS